jgi:hypothetical protein
MHCRRSGLRVNLAHGDVVDRHPSLGSAADVRDADRADLEAVVFENDAVIVEGLGMNDLAEIQIHLARGLRLSLGEIPGVGGMVRRT